MLLPFCILLFWISPHRSEASIGAERTIEKRLVQPSLSLESCLSDTSKNETCTSWLMKRSCHEYYLAGSRDNGIYYVGMDKSQVFCTFANSIGITQISHNFPPKTIIRRPNNEEVSFKVDYNMKIDVLTKLIEDSQDCTQEITFFCPNASSDETVVKFRWGDRDYLSSIRHNNYDVSGDISTQFKCAEKNRSTTIRKDHVGINIVAFTGDGHTTVQLSMGPIICKGSKDLPAFYASGKTIYRENIDSFAFSFLLSYHNQQLFRLRNDNGSHAVSVVVSDGHSITFEQFPSKRDSGDYRVTLFSQRLLSDAQWHSFALKKITNDNVMVTLDDHSYALNMSNALWSQPATLVFGDFTKNEDSNSPVAQNDRCETSSKTVFHQDQICFTHFKLNDKDIQPSNAEPCKRTPSINGTCGIQPMTDCTASACLNQKCPCALSISETENCTAHFHWFCYHNNADGYQLERSYQTGRTDLIDLFTMWKQSSFLFKTESMNNSQLMWNYNRLRDQVVQVDLMEESTTLRLLVCSVPHIYTHSDLALRGIALNYSCVTCSLEQITGFNSGSPIPVTVMRHNDTMFVLKVMDSACLAQQRFLNFTAVSVPADVKMAPSYWLLGSIHVNKSFVGSITNLIVDGTPLELKSETPATQPPTVTKDACAIKPLDRCNCGDSGVCKLAGIDAICQCSSSFLPTTPSYSCNEQRKELHFNKTARLATGVFDVFNFTQSPRKKREDKSEDDRSVLRLRTVIVPERSFADCCEESLMVLRFGHLHNEFNITMTVIKEPNKDKLRITYSKRIGNGIERDSFLHPIDSDMDNFIHLKFHHREAKLDVRVNTNKTAVDLQRLFHPREHMWNLIDIRVGHISGPTFVGKIRSDQELDIIKLLEPLDSSLKVESSEPLDLFRLKRPYPTVLNGHEPNPNAQKVPFPKKKAEESLSALTIILIVLFILVCLILLAFIIFFCCCKNRSNETAKEDPDKTGSPPTIRVFRRNPSKSKSVNGEMNKTSSDSTEAADTQRDLSSAVNTEEESKGLRTLKESEVVERQGSPMRRRDNKPTPTPRLANTSEAFDELSLI